MHRHSPLKAFLSFSHRDFKLCAKLRAHLSTLVNDKQLIELWWDRDLRDGEWDPEIMNQLDCADIVLLLVSAEYIESPNCRKEYDRAMERHQARSAGDEDGAIVVPIWVRDCRYEQAKFGKLNPLPAGYRSIDKWSNQDEAFKQVAVELEEIIEKRDSHQAQHRRFTEGASRSPEDEGNLLPYLCDRSELVKSLRQMVLSTTEMTSGKTRPHRPFVFVMHGYEDDCPEGFKSRLEYKILPSLFKVEGRIVPIPIDWPRDCSSEEAAMREFAWYVSARLGCEPQTIHDSLPATITLFVSFLDQALWQNNGDKILDGFLRFWDSFPDLTSKRIVSCLIVQLRRASAGPAEAPRSGWLPRLIGKSRDGRVSPRPVDEAMQLALNTLSFSSNINGIKLPLLPITQMHVENWVDEPDVRAWCRPQSENDMRRDLRSEFAARDERPMGELVDPMRTALMRYKITV